MLTDTLATTDLTHLTDTDLIDSIHSAHQALTRHKARFIITLGEFHDRDLAKEHGSPSTIAWLVRHHDLSRRTAFEYLGTGTKLREFPLMAAEFLSGRLSYSKVRLLLRYVTGANEDELVDLALRLCLSELEQALAGRPRTGGGRKPRGNSFNVVVDEETGELSFWGRLDAERGSGFMAALKTGELSYLRDLTDLDPAVFDDPDALDAEIDTAHREVEQESGADTPSPAAPTRFGAPLGTGLLASFLGVINLVRSSPRNKLRAPGAQINVMLTVDGRVVIPGHHGAETAELLTSVLNGDLAFHLLDRRGLHLNLSRSARTVSGAQEKALLTRWGHRCAAPGCHHSRFLEFHHITAWAAGGATDLDNLIPLCSGCHALVTSGRVSIHVDEINPQLLRFRFPGGESHTSEARDLPVRNGRMGRWGDGYTHGPVPVGDEHLLQRWDSSDSFDDPIDERGDRLEQNLSPGVRSCALPVTRQSPTSRPG